MCAGVPEFSHCEVSIARVDDDPNSRWRDRCEQISLHYRISDVAGRADHGAGPPEWSDCYSARLAVEDRFDCIDAQARRMACIETRRRERLQQTRIVRRRRNRSRWSRPLARVPCTRAVGSLIHEMKRSDGWVSRARIRAWTRQYRSKRPGHGLGVYGNTYEVFPGGGYTHTGTAIKIHMPGIRFLIKDVDAAIAEADRRVNERV